MIFKYLRKKDFVFIAIIIALIVSQVYLELKIPDYMTTITKELQTGSSVDQVMRDGWPMIACAFASLIASVVTGFFAALIATSLAMTLRKREFDRVEQFSMAEINRFSISSLITRSTNDITQVQMAFALGLVVIVKAPIMAIWAITIIAGKNFNWSLTVIGAVVAIMIIIAVLMFFVIPLFRKIQWINDDVNRVTKENITGIRVVHAYNAEDYQEEKFRAENKRLTDTHLTITRSLSIMAPLIGSIMSFMALAIYWVGAIIIDNAGSLPERVSLFADMVTFSAYAMQVIMAFLMIVIVFMIVPRAAVAYRRVEEVINTEPSIRDGTETSGKTDMEGCISFKGVSFKYPNASDYVLKDISFDAKKGETIAFIGSTGSGKSTLVNLIPRFYDASEGSITVDGIDIKDYTLNALHGKIGYVPQKAVMFNRTIAENVLYGDTEDGRTMDDVKNAVEIAQGKKFVEATEEGYNRMVSEGGTNLSGGQKQRISIARAVCRRPEFYIFDDSFSALDYRTDRVLRSTLKKETAGVTTFIVAQRIGTIIDSDKIVVLNEGRIVGIGKHSELLKNCDVYREIALSQLSEKELSL